MTSPPPDPPRQATRAAAPTLTRARALDAASVRIIIFGIMLAMLLSALDQTIVATALPVIGRELGDFGNLSWVVTAYLLSATAVTPLYGKLSDIHGRRTVLLAGIGLFVAGSIACALARTMPALVLARAVQGLGGGGLIALAQTIIADVVTPKERARYQVHFSGLFAGANVIGAVAGGYCAEYPFQLGTATAAMNFFRQLGGAILVAGFGAILLSGVGLGGGGGRAADMIAGAGTNGGSALAEAFRWIFGAAACSLAASFGFLFIMEERPLRERPPGEAPAE